VTRDFRIDIKYTDEGAPRLKVVKTRFKASDVKMSKRRAGTKPPAVKPKPYLSLLGKAVNLVRYVQVTAEWVPVDDTKGLLFSVYTSGAPKSAQFVDSWGEIEPEHPRTGFACLASTRTRYNLWVPRDGDFERNAIAEIARATGIKHPPRYM